MRGLVSGNSVLEAVAKGNVLFLKGIFLVRLSQTVTCSWKKMRWKSGEMLLH